MDYASQPVRLFSYKRFIVTCRAGGFMNLAIDPRPACLLAQCLIAFGALRDQGDAHAGIAERH
ncbi:hypothetical protein [Mesorhizobium sp. WSM3626]|uniref:hypothetical protein n=1 Tax=Mesorhizobium sp. WSM3626 TaxID=1040987 RepID=UPI0018DE822E|nr:hypothetical protein [Mesorhizobium sp. WSM3626]